MLVTRGKRFSSEAFFYLRIPLQVAFSLFFFPIKVDWDNRKPVLIFKTSYPRKVAFVIINGTALLSFLIRLAVDLKKSIQDNPVALYDIVRQTFEVLLAVLWVRTCWNTKKGLKHLMRTCYDYAFGKVDKIPFKRRCLLAGLCWLNTLGNFAMFLFPAYGVGLNFTEQSWIRLQKNAEFLRQCFQPGTNQSKLQGEGISYSMLTAGLVYDLNNIYSYTLFHCAINFLCMTSYVSYHVSKEYWGFLIKQKRCFEEIQQSYQEVSSLIQSFNGALSELYLIHILWFIPFFSKHTTNVVANGNWQDLIMVVIHASNAAFILIFSAVANETFGELVEYVCENQGRFMKEGVRKCDLTLFVIRLKRSVKTVGLKGSKFFIINFHFIGSFVGAWASFLVIVLQFQSNDHKPAGSMN